MSSAAEFVEGGVQDPCGDACSICLEVFCDEDPASITDCNHAYHLQCILEWVQRSSKCPMCWQPLVMKDPVGKGLLESAEQERFDRSNQIHATCLPHRSEDYELDQFASYEERLRLHLAAASASQIHGQWWRNQFHFQPASNEYPGQFIHLPSTLSAASASLGTLSVSDSQQEEHLANARSHSTFASGDARPRCCNAAHSHLPSATSELTSECPSFFKAIKSHWTAASSKYKNTFAKATYLLWDKMWARNATRLDSGVCPQDLSTGVAQALGQISLECPGERRLRKKASAYVSLEQSR